MADINIKGLDQLQELLNTLPAKIEQNVLRGALRAGAMVVRDEAKAHCPVGKPSADGVMKYGHYEGALRDSIRVSVRAKAGKVTASVKAGGKLKNGADVFYAHIIEFTGAKRHPITSKKGHMLTIGGAYFKAVDHPGMRPRPFFRPALDSRASDAVLAVGEYIKKRLATKEGMNTADIDIEVEA